MFRTLAALAIAVSLDVYFYNGKILHALWSMAHMIRL
jgi:hypothetical protein